MNQSRIEAEKGKILSSLSECGADGIIKSKLCGSSKTCTTALNELIKDKKVFNLGSSRKTRYVLSDYYRPLERAYESIEKYFNSSDLILNSKNKLIEKIKPFPAVKKKFDEALDLLVQEQKILKLKTGNYFSYLGVTPIIKKLNLSTSTQDVSPPVDENEFKQQVKDAYFRLVKRTGFSAVEIFTLHKESNVPLEWLKQHILNLRKERKADLFFGDWSLSSEDIRSGAIEIDGDRFLLVRFNYEGYYPNESVQ